jgi:hypothetical protein
MTRAAVAFRDSFAKATKNERNILNLFYTEDRGSFFRNVVIYASHITEHHYLNINCGENFNIQDVLENLYTPTESV